MRGKEDCSFERGGVFGNFRETYFNLKEGGVLLAQTHRNTTLWTFTRGTGASASENEATVKRRK